MSLKDFEEKSEEENGIVALSGQGNQSEKALRDRAKGLKMEGDDTEIEAW